MWGHTHLQRDRDFTLTLLHHSLWNTTLCKGVIDTGRIFFHLLRIINFSLTIFCFIKAWKNGFVLFDFLVSVMYSWTLCTVLSAPAGETPEDSLVRHVRNKRCSCASFQDKECVYFCHMDIIWVNTPERVVSYGLGNAPRRRRALPAPSESMVTGGGPRCKCAKENDNTCANFCRLENRPRNGTPPDTMKRSPKGDGCSGTHCEHKLSTGTGKTNRMNNSNKKQVSPLAIRTALKTRLLLEKWRLRQQHHRAG